MPRDGGPELVDEILMRRLTKCIRSYGGHYPRAISVPVFDSKFSIWKSRIVGWNNCPRCGIKRSYVWSHRLEQVIGLEP